MQQPAHTPAHAQHVPNGWSFPTLTVPTPPAPQSMPVVGGGAASTVTRVRWGRLLPVFAGLALVAFGLWSITQDSGGPGSTVAGGGSAASTPSDVEIARSARTDVATDRDDAADDAAAADLDAAVTPPAAAPAPRTTPGPARAGAARAGAPRPNRARGVRRGAGAAAAGTMARTPSATAANGVPRTASGGGGPAGELPLTGIETWIAGILGALLLGIGIVVHVNAVRLAATAMLYRRGILLRPVDCARLAQERGFPQSRVWLSNVLHRLLEEPAGGRDFVATRMR